MGAEEVVLLLIAAAAAGWVDAVVGGGGLVQLPALLLAAPDMPVAAALATNKVASVAGTSSAAVAYARRTRLDLPVALPAAALALLCAGLGAASAAAVSSAVLRPVVMAALLIVAVLVVARPALGTAARPGLRTRGRVLAAIAVTGGAVAFYDGILGPGTGLFLVIAFTTLLGMDFVHGSAMAKVLNTSTNLGALAVFAVQGHVLWGIGLAMAACSVAGAQLGARMALRRGAGFVRAVLLCVVAALVVKLGVDQFA
ncbi:TSUP family transporter [Bailinhaonella thermotolerans]|uniref:Probable membrane transporter protein n=1 Tax=Bailinhaonella thermotolerans TaxID=1070861 RepID=A0A3A4B8T8_9ACTN|nr:TSUP family transporter [Bailinhaonella thermotolerans]RJL35319.1 sulfite exporter TauE/SafE family protein [Bailinhaonella thermotolerans]